MKTMNKSADRVKLLAVFAVMAVVFASVAVMASEESDAERHPTAANTQMLDVTKFTTGEGANTGYTGEATYSENTLTLTNYDGPGLFYNEENALTIKLVGTNTITVERPLDNNGYAGIYSSGAKLTIVSGEEDDTTVPVLNVTVTGKNTLYQEDKSAYTYGIDAAKGLDVTGVEMHVSVSTDSEYAFAVYVGGGQGATSTFTKVTGDITGGNRGIQVSSGTLTFKDSKLTISGGEKAIQNKNITGSVMFDKGSDITLKILDNGLKNGGNNNVTGLNTYSTTVNAGAKLTSEGITVGYDKTSDGNADVEAGTLINNGTIVVDAIEGVEGSGLIVKGTSTLTNGTAASDKTAAVKGTITLNAGATLQIDDATNFKNNAGTIALDEDADLNITDFDSAYDILETMDAQDGDIAVIGGRTYQIFVDTVGNGANKVTVYYGVYVNDPEYTGEPIADSTDFTEYVHPGIDVFQMTDSDSPTSYTVNPEPSTIKAVDGDDMTSIGEHKFKMAVTVANGGVSTTRTLTVTFNILPATPDLDVTNGEWNEGAYDGEVKITGPDYEFGDPANPGEMTFVITDSTGTVVESGKISELQDVLADLAGPASTDDVTSKTYTLTISLAASTGERNDTEKNYYGATTATATLTVGKYAPLPVKIDFSGNVTEELIGIDPTKVQEEIICDIGAFENVYATGTTTTESYKTVVSIIGKVYKLEAADVPTTWGFTKVTGANYYLVLTLSKTDGTALAADDVKVYKTDATNKNGAEITSGYADVTPKDAKARTYVLMLGDDLKNIVAPGTTIDNDSEAFYYGFNIVSKDQTHNLDTLYNLDLTGLNKYQLIIVEESQTLYYDGTENVWTTNENAYVTEDQVVLLPRGMDASQNFQNWTTRVGEITYNENSYIVVKDELSAENKIYLDAVYGDTPVDPTPIDPTQGTVIVTGYVLNGKAYFSVYADDGLAIPADDLKVMYTYYDAELGIVDSDEIESVSIESGIFGTIAVDVPAGAIAVYAVYGSAQSNVFYA